MVFDEPTTTTTTGATSPPRALCRPSSKLPHILPFCFLWKVRNKREKREGVFDELTEDGGWK